MTDNDSTAEKRTDQQNQLLRQLPGFYLNKGTPCTCGKDAITTRKQVGYSDSVVYTHHCGDCGNEFSTWIEG